MKIKKLFLLLTVCGFSFVGLVQGQKQISREQFYSVSQNAYSESRKLPRRVETTVNSFRDGKLVEIINTLQEVLPPDKQHKITKTTKAGKTNIIETIEIGTETYIRENDGSWMKGTQSGFGGGIAGSSRQREKYTIIDSNYKNEEVKIYEQLITVESLLMGEHSYWKNKLWINKDGLIIKEETINGFTEQNITNHRIMEYAYEPNIKIEAPKIN